MYVMKNKIEYIYGVSYEVHTKKKVTRVAIEFG